MKDLIRIEDIDTSKYKQHRFRWLPATYKVETMEFSDSQTIVLMDYYNYLLRWVYKLKNNGKEAFVVERTEKDNYHKKITLFIRR